MFATASRYMQSEDDAKDVLQNAYVKIFQNISKIDYINEASTLAWMKRICINEALNLIRKKKSWDRIQVTHDAMIVTDNQTLMSDDIFKVLSTLPEKQRIVFSLFAIEGYKHKEIATMLNITDTNSRTIYGRAKKYLSAHPTLKMMYETA